MKIVSPKCCNKYPDSKAPLEQWYMHVKQALWKNLLTLKDFNHVDFIGNQRYVFNIKGNKYRLVVVIQFTHGYVYIRFVGSHSNYDSINCLTI